MSERKQEPRWKPLYFPAIAEQLLDKAQCESIIETAETMGFRPTAVFGGANTGASYNEDVRVCDAVALSPQAQRNIYNLVAAAIKQVNDKQYRFGLVGLEPVQVLRYSVGSFFREHSDLGYQSDESSGRKISLIAQLSPENAYEGGSLVLFGEDEMPKSQGTVCIFPSWLPHRVDELTAGTRYTLVAWAIGPPFN